MAWTKAVNNRTHRGWTKNPRYNCRNAREQNGPVTIDETERKKNADALLEQAKRVEKRTFNTEDAKRRADAVCERKGLVVKVVVKNLTTTIGHQTKLPIFEVDADYRGWGRLLSETALHEGDIGLYLGMYRTKIKKYVERKLRTVDLVVYQYVFGDKIYYFTRGALQHLDVV